MLEIDNILKVSSELPDLEVVANENISFQRLYNVSRNGLDFLHAHKILDFYHPLSQYIHVQFCTVLLV